MLAASIARAAQLCDVPDHHLRQAVKSGALPYTQLGIRKILILDDVKQWLRSHQRVENPHAK